jgi:hypothetical protein
MSKLGPIMLFALVAALSNAQEKEVKSLKLRIVAIEDHDDPKPTSVSGTDDKGTKLILITAHPILKVTGEDSANRVVLSCEWVKTYTIPLTKPDEVPWCPKFFHVGQFVTFQKNANGWAAIEVRGIEGVTESAMPKDKQMPFQIVEEGPSKPEPCR